MGKPSHILIENEEGYRHCRDTLIERDTDVTWHTTSPWLLEKLPRLNEKVYSLEQFSSPEDVSRIGYASIDVSYDMAAYINELCEDFSEELLPGKAMRQRMQFCLNVLVYKATLLHRWFTQYSKTGDLIIAGNLQMSPIKGFECYIERYDHVYINLAYHSGVGDIKIIPYNSELVPKNLFKALRMDMSKFEKTLYFLNKDLSDFLFDVWTGLQRRKIFKNNYIQFGKNQKPMVIFMKKCELLSEAFFPLIRRRLGIAYVPDKKLDMSLLKQPLPFEKDPFAEKTIKTVLSRLTQRRLGFNPFYEGVCRIFTEQVYQSLEYSRSVINEISNFYETLFVNGHRKIALATNALNSPTVRMFQQYLVKQRVPVFSFEHGIGAGITTQTEYYHSRNQYTEGGDFMVCFNNASYEAFTNGREPKYGIIAGAPKVSQTIPFYHLQRILGRKYLKVSHHERLITFIANVSRNNMFYFPRTQRDIEYYQFTKSIVRDVFSRISDRCLLKLYPSNRYSDPDPFDELIEKSENVQVVQYFEFTQLRAAVDVIILSSAQSTFGWAWSTKVPVIFINPPTEAIYADVKELVEGAVFKIDGSQEGWPNQVVDLLKLPHRELLALWERKKEARRELDSLMFGPTRRSGQRVAEYIAQQTQDWYQTQ